LQLQAEKMRQALQPQAENVFHERRFIQRPESAQNAARLQLEHFILFYFILSSYFAANLSSNEAPDRTATVSIWCYFTQNNAIFDAISTEQLETLDFLFGFILSLQLKSGRNRYGQRVSTAWNEWPKFV